VKSTCQLTPKVDGNHRTQPLKRADKVQSGSQGGEKIAGLGGGLGEKRRKVATNL